MDNVQHNYIVNERPPSQTFSWSQSNAPWKVSTLCPFRRFLWRIHESENNKSINTKYTISRISCNIIMTEVILSLANLTWATQHTRLQKLLRPFLPQEMPYPSLWKFFFLGGGRYSNCFLVVVLLRNLQVAYKVRQLNNRTNVIVRKLPTLIRMEHMITTRQFCV
jgi:hypothetical protein